MADEKVVIELVLDDKDFKKVTKALPEKFDSVGKKSGNSFTSGFKSGLSKFGNTLAAPFKRIKGEFLALGASIAGGLLFKKAINEADKLETSLIGLKSVTASFGGDVDGITEAAKELASDGLIPLTDVTASLKNLILNFDGDLEKSISTFKSFRDAAAFGRQGSLALGEAIVGASEGLKNDLSVKVDNAGVTRNLSLLQKDYAKELGISVGRLTEAQKAEAEYLGVKKEAATFQGDYNKLLNTFSGAQSRVAGATRFLLAALGEIVTKSPLVVKGINDQAQSIQNLTAKVKVFAEGEGLKNLLLSFVEVGRGINTYLVKPFEFVFDILNIVQKSFQVFLQGILQGVTGIGSFIGQALNKIGIDNPLTKALSDFDDVAFDQLKTQLQEFTELSESAFGFEQSEKITSFFDGLQTSIVAGAPALETLGKNLKGAEKDLGGLAKGATGAAKAVNNALNNAVTKSASQGIQSLTKSLLLGEDGFSNFGKAIAGILGDMAVQLGETLLLSGLGIEALNSLGGAGAIAAGAGLIALGTILKSFSGGGGTSPSAGTVGGAFTEDQATGIGGDEPVERQEEQAGINITIRGDVLDSNESGMRIVQIINDAYDQEGVIINRGAIG